MELEPEVITGAKINSHTGSACMKILPNSSKYKRGEMKGRPLEGVESVSDKQSSEHLLRSTSPDLIKRMNSPSHFQELGRFSMSEEFKLVNAAGHE